MFTAKNLCVWKTDIIENCAWDQHMKKLSHLWHAREFVLTNSCLSIYTKFSQNLEMKFDHVSGFFADVSLSWKMPIASQLVKKIWKKNTKTWLKLIAAFSNVAGLKPKWCSLTPVLLVEPFHMNSWFCWITMAATLMQVKMTFFIAKTATIKQTQTMLYPNFQILKQAGLLKNLKKYTLQM